MNESYWEKQLKENKRNGNARVQLALRWLNTNKVEIAIEYLEKAFSPELSDPIIPIDSFQGKFLARVISKYRSFKNEYSKSLYYLKLADNSKADLDDTTLIGLAMFITGYPRSVEDAKSIIKYKHKLFSKIFKKKELKLNVMHIGSDLYGFLIFSPFYLETYYEADFKQTMKCYYDLTLKINDSLLNHSEWINLRYTANFINNKKLKKKDKYKIAVVSAFFYPNNSVIDDFGNMLQKLNEELFDITFVYIQSNPGIFVFSDRKHIIIKNENWLIDYRNSLEKLELDFILFLDPVMCPKMQRIMISKVSHVQAVSHGHPVTSGIPKSIVDYYISWGAAEIDTAQAHYTEELILLDENIIHQYYEPRHYNGKSIIDNCSFENITRTDFDLPSNCIWYVCMQKPFKRHPEFDDMIKTILNKVENAIVILHRDNLDNQTIIDKRIQHDRIYMLPSQPHHKLLALYKLSDINLDSYYAGGCTTSRESLELNCPIVTLPGKYLGSRWTYGYYKIINVLDLVASSKKEYIEIAVKLAIEKEYRLDIKTKIRQSLYKMYKCTEAVKSWEQTILKGIEKKIT